MQKRALGRTGLKVTEIGFGGIPIQRLSEEEAIKVVRAAFDSGINFFDTARAYDTSEHRMGLALKDARNECVLATKGMVTTKEEAERDFKTSLKELNVKKVDLYQVHNVGDKRRLDGILGKGGALEAAKKARKKGLTDFIGITGHVPHLLKEAIETGEFDTVQVPFNIVEQQSAELIRLAKKLNVGVIIMKPFAGGALTDSNSIKFILEQPISTVIPGMESEKQIRENISMTEAMLTEEEKKKLVNESEKIERTLCRRCGYCMPCPAGINIVMVNTFNRMHEWMNMKDVAKRKYAALPVKADACTECRQCEQKCPYRLPVAEMMKKAHKNLG